MRIQRHPIVSLTAIACLSAAAWAAPAAPVRIVAPIDDNHRVTLVGNTHPLARARYDRGRVSPELPMGDLVLVLARGPEQQAAFDKFVASQYDPASPNYHQWLEPAEVGERFGPAPSDVDAVANWLRGHSFSIDEIAPDRLSIRFGGTAADVESAFHTQIHNLDVHGQQHVANMSDPQIPAALAQVVAGVKALHNFFPRPLHRLGATVVFNREIGKWQRVDASPDALGQKGSLQPAGGVHPLFGTTDAYGDLIEDVSPWDFAKIYNVQPLWQAASPIDGTGQTIAIAGTSNIDLADVAAFRSAFDLPANAPSVIVTNYNPGTCLSLAPSCYGDLVENSLDVEWAGAVAKGAKILLVTSSAPTATTDALYLSESYIVQHKRAPIMNVSYGDCELAMGTAGNIEYANLWQTAATEGIAVFVASGDAGSPACDQDYDAIQGIPYGAQFGLAVSGLTSTPWNTSVGGTDFNWSAKPASYWSATSNATTKASALGYVPEVAWDSTCTNPLVLPALESDAAYLGISGVQDAESACNFIVDNWPSILSGYGADLAWLVDTIGGGGGASTCTTSNDGYPDTCSGGYAKPAWQGNVPGIPADGKRDVPDISFFASNGFLGSSYLICVSAGGNSCTYSGSTEPVGQEVGGTSVASPAMAGVMALINQKAGAPQGNPNTLLYAIAAHQSYAKCSAEKIAAGSTCAINDIDSGTNAMDCLTGSDNCNTLYGQDVVGVLSGFSATAGYDQATGLGSLNVANVVNGWPSATAPIASMSPFSLAFTATEQGAKAATQVITLKNTGHSALSLGSTGQGIAIAGADATSFSQTNTCGSSVAAGASCTITVTFKPAATGTLSAAVTLTDNGWQSPQTVSLGGTGTPGLPAIYVGAQSIGFGATSVGSTNMSGPIAIDSTGYAPISFSSITLTGANASSFSLTKTCGTTLAVGASCSVTITFKPTKTGTLSATLDIADNVKGSPQTISLSGTGK